MMPDLVSDGLIVGGGLLLLAGAWLIAPELAMVVAGGLLLLAGLIRARNTRRPH